MDYFASEHVTRPHHFFIPMSMAIIGGAFAHFESWAWVGYLIVGIAVVNTVWLFYTTYKDHELKLIQEEHSHYAEIMKMDAAKTKTRVAIEKTDLTGYMYQNYTDLDIAPAKIKKFAIGVLQEGRKLTIREWTPMKKGKLFSDGEWRRLMDFMKRPDWEDKHVKFAVPLNPNNENDGYEPTAAGRKWLEDVLEESVLVPVT